MSASSTAPPFTDRSPGRLQKKLLPLATDKRCEDLAVKAAYAGNRDA